MIKIQKKIWPPGLVMGTFCFVSGIVYIVHPWDALPFSEQLLFIGAGFAFFFSVFTIRRDNKQPFYTGVKQ